LSYNFENALEEMMNPLLKEIYEFVITGQKDDVEEKVKQAIAEQLAPKAILDNGLIAAMSEVGDRFENGDFYVPEMLIAARAMQTGMALLKPLLMEADIQPEGKVVIGTVKGDLHDIGKNLVGMMLEGAGFEVIDLGTDIAPEKFAALVREHQPDLMGMSALLTTTMPEMKNAIEALVDIGAKDKVKVIIGGAPITSAYAEEIGANGYAPDAASAVTLAKSLLSKLSSQDS
jgi:5-methyltetrahydrofolate--homocysteine methyltransferase